MNRLDIHLNPEKYQHHKDIVEAIENRELSIHQSKSSFIIYLLTEGLKSINKTTENNSKKELSLYQTEEKKENKNEEIKKSNDIDGESEIVYDDYNIDIDDFNFDAFS